LPVGAVTAAIGVPLFLFLMSHPNVAIVQSLDTAVPMILRGPSTSKSEESMFPSDLELIRTFESTLAVAPALSVTPVVPCAT